MAEPIWSKHYQRVWAERSGNTRLPDWLRLVSLAYGSHGANGHAPFARGEIALALGRMDEERGEFVPGRNVARAIRVAVEHGFLSPRSTPRCLVVPAHAIGGPHGNPLKPCPEHGEAF